MRVLIEVAFLVAGLIAAAVIAGLAAWSYPRATDDIWLVAYAAMAAVLLMGIGPIRRAYLEDRAKLSRGERADG
jgi:membrane protein implicated in regulation of membrane protease activity